MSARATTPLADRLRARAARWIFGAALVLYALTGGGRIVGSDEVTMLELSRALLRGGIAVPEGATLRGPDGRAYTKGAAAQAVLAMPLVVAGEAAGRVAGVEPARRELAVRFVVSFFDAVVTALLLGGLYTAARELGIGPRAALGAALLLGFSTPLWPYAKSFMAEPLQALGLLLALWGVALPERRGAGRLAGVGVFLAVSAKLSMLPLALAALLPLLGAPPRAWRGPAIGLALALVGHALYNQARFGTPLETGYGAQATAGAYTTPLWVGVYGLLLSSGKGVLWFAPVLWLASTAWARALAASDGTPWWRLARWVAGLGPQGRVALGAAGAWVVALLLYGRFQHWAGDGSFGPRYLIPVIPLAMLVVALALERAGRTMRRLTLVLGVLGALVQVGGVAVYFGAQMREAGDYPYTLPLEHPRSMSDSHFNPRFTPILGHWRILLRNAGEHLRGQAPRLAPAPAADARIPVAAEDQARLLHALDFWWLYLYYAGIPPGPIVAVVVALAGLAGWLLRRAWMACDLERRAAA